MNATDEQETTPKTIGFGPTSEVIHCRRIIFKGHVECRGWGNGALNRNTLDTEEDKCTLEIDLTYRLYRATAIRTQEPFEGALENVQQYFRLKMVQVPVPRGRRGRPPKSDTSTATSSPQ